MPRGKLALGQNSTEIMSSDKSNSAAMFLRIQTDMHLRIFAFMDSVQFILKILYGKALEMCTYENCASWS